MYFAAALSLCGRGHRVHPQKETGMSMTFALSHCKRPLRPLLGVTLALLLSAASLSLRAENAMSQASRNDRPGELDAQLDIALRKAGFTGRIESTLEARLGRPVDKRLADLGRKLFFDPLGGLHNDNTCAGCHAPSTGFGDTQSIAIGVQSNRVVGPGRAGPRNQRRTPTVVNTAFYPALMWNGRFSAPSGNPFDNSAGFTFPPPEGTGKFPPNDPVVRHLLIAQAHIPPTELNEAAGFTGTKGTLNPRFDVFDDGLGGVVPMPDGSGFRNEPIRAAVAQRLNDTPAYVQLFGDSFPSVRSGAPITPLMFAQAIAEFEFTLVRADAPIDQFARGRHDAMSDSEKRGALLFFGKAGCVACHAVAGASNEMFSDFKNRTLGVPQIAPYFGVGKGNTIFDGVGEDEDFGLEQVSGQASDRYKFRTSPLRNVALQPAFLHNGAFTRLDDAIRHHLDVLASSQGYSASRAGVAKDLRSRQGPSEPVLQALDPLLAVPIRLNADEFEDLNRFVSAGLLDSRALPKAFCKLIPQALPSGFRPLSFQGCGGD
jgi:cytochrome c peroxidase